LLGNVTRRKRPRETNKRTGMVWGIETEVASINYPLL